MKCLIVDDDYVSLEILKKYVSQTGSLELGGVCSDGIEASNRLRENQIDLLILDVEMPGMSGLDLLNSLKNPPYVILVTSKKEYAVEAFEHEVTDYLVKPIDYSRFVKAVEKVLNRFKQNIPPSKDNAKHIFVKTDSKLVKLEVDNILFIEAFGDYIIIHSPEKNYTVYNTMKNIENKLPSEEFLRVHRSFIIRIDKIEDIQEGNLLIEKKIIPIGPSYKNQLMTRLNII